MIESAECTYRSNHLKSIYFGGCNYVQACSRSHAARFGINGQLQYYSTELLSTIIERSAEILMCQSITMQLSKLREKELTYC